MEGSPPDLAKGNLSGHVFAGRDDLTRDNYAAPDFQRWLTPPSSENYRGTVAECKSAPPELRAALAATQRVGGAFDAVFIAPASAVAGQ